jgi:uncharacterized membrane-anchored protein
MTDTKQKTIRVTVPVTPLVQEVFKRLSVASGVSMGKAMGDWLADTSDAALAMADLMEKARQQPKLVASQLHGYALGLTDMTTELLDTLRKSAAPLTPPVGNTGGKLPKKAKKSGGANG